MVYNVLNVVYNYTDSSRLNIQRLQQTIIKIKLGHNCNMVSHIFVYLSWFKEVIK
jgi:hypothetical protein